MIHQPIAHLDYVSASIIITHKTKLSNVSRVIKLKVDTSTNSTFRLCFSINYYYTQD